MKLFKEKYILNRLVLFYFCLPYWIEAPLGRVDQCQLLEENLHREVHQALPCHPSKTESQPKLYISKTKKENYYQTIIKCISINKPRSKKGKTIAIK
jgi:hypothetical protein